MLKRRAAAPLPSHEEIFLQRYRWLMASALRLTARDRQQAEDLVHDVFIHFTLDRPELERVQNLDGYLYAMMRNMHISQLRRAARVRATSISSSELSISDYDFIGDGIQAIEQRAQQTQDELRRICEYACTRKATSKTGSVLILRFFHGYYPAEIAKFLRSSRASVDKWLQIARSEVKLYLSDPNALGFIGKSSVAIQLSNAAPTTEDFVNELRSVIFKPLEQECFTAAQLQELYFSTEAGSIECQALGHIVSCTQCLDAVNALLDLPLLSDRYPTKTLNTDKRKPDSNGGSGPGASSGGRGEGSGGDDFLARSRRRRKRVLEHRPQQLRISVNGFILGSQDVSAELNKQTISVKGEEKIGFVEVFSEQEVRLLFSNVEPPPDGPIEHRKRVELSDHRSVELMLDFSESWPSLHVTYHDPTFAMAESEAVGSRQEAEGRVPLSTRSQVQNPKHKAQNPRFFSVLRASVVNFFKSFDLGLFSRPASVTALFALLLIAAVAILYRRTPTPPLSAASLLQKAAASEEMIASNPNQVVHRIITLEERVSEPRADRGPRAGTPRGVVAATGSPSQIVSRRRLELWRSGAQQAAALRVYDEQNQLINGQWTKGGVSRVLLHHGAKLQPAPSARILESSIAFAEVWQLAPSAGGFASLIGRGERAIVSESASEYTINYQRADTNADGLQAATLVLNRPELRAIRQTLVVKQGSEVREYVFSESSFEQRQVSAVAPSVFEPDPALLGDTGTRGSGDTGTISASPSLPVAASPVTVASAELEVEVVRQLNQVNAFLGEQINVERTLEGRLQVKGIVETDERKSELLQALISFRSNPAVKIEITTVAEVLKRQRQSPSTSATTSEVASGTGESPVDAELRQYFSKRGVPAEQLNQEVQRFSSRALNHSFQARRHALALKQIAERFSLEDLRGLDPEARAKWFAMLAQHARALQQETAVLRRDLESVFPSLAAGSTGADVASDEALVRAAQQLFAVAVDNDEKIRRSFAIYAGAPGLAPVKTAQFWQSLGNAERIAQAISSR